MERVGLHVEDEQLARSVHGKLSCVDCHKDLAGKSLPHPKATQKVDCAGCHQANNHFGAPDVNSRVTYADSVHGQAAARGDRDAPRCADCHGDHNILPPSNPDSPISRFSVAETCGRCHSNPGFVQRHHITKGNIVDFQRSVHGQALIAKGLVVAAVCTDCHGVHDIRVGSDPRSSASRPHIPKTCGKCHLGIYRQYEAGIHGQAFARGVKEAPVCTDCHGEHNILPPEASQSTINPLHVVKTCSHCHANVKIERAFGFPAQRLSTYLSSYHGIANSYGDITVANCASCHGAHDILPSADPRSSINPKNIPETCGRCHPGVGVKIALGSVHLLPSPQHDAIVYWVKLFYQIFVALLVTSFIGQVLLDLLSYRRRRGEA